jgi:hypothetical protein
VLNRGYCPHLFGAELRSVLKKRVVRPVEEEASCQACEKLSLGERVYWEVVFSQRESNTSYEALIILDPACCQDLEREVKHQWTVPVKVYTLGWNMHVENESPCIVGVRRILERILLVSLCNFPITSA